jgi:hypothetical protein
MLRLYWTVGEKSAGRAVLLRADVYLLARGYGYSLWMIRRFDWLIDRDFGGQLGEGQ